MHLVFIVIVKYEYLDGSFGTADEVKFVNFLLIPLA